MTNALRLHSWLSVFIHFLEHSAAVIVGLLLMIIGLGLGITMIMLPFGIVVGLLGFAIVIAGIFTRIDRS